MSYCIYLRKSRKDQELEALSELETLQRHYDALIKMAREKNLNIVKIYKEVISGESIDARPEMQKLLDDVSNGIYKGVLVMEVERLARGNTIDQGIVAEAFKVSNTKIITPAKIYDPNNEFDEEYFEFGLFMARREYKVINRRIQRGRLASVSEGKYIASTAPYGYDKEKIKLGKGYTLKINEAQSKIVKLIYELYLQGLSLNAIATKLDTMCKPLNSKYWSRSTIKDILTNPVYIGKIRWGHRKEKKIYEDGKIKKSRTPNNDYQLIDGLHPPIIEENTFYEVQKMFKDSYKPPVCSNKELKNPFTNLVFCSKCGARLTRVSSNTKDNYYSLKCPTKNCKTVPIPIYLLEQHLIPILKSWVEDETLIFKQKENLNNSLSTVHSSLILINREIEKIEKQIENIHNLLEQGIYSIDVFMSRNKKLKTELDELSSKQFKLIEEENKINNMETTKREFIPKVQNLINLYGTIEDASLKNKLLSEVIYKIIYQRDTRTKKNQRDLAMFNITVYPSFFKE
ncbi:recombinase family protein [[Clostridium] colinum]|uniref:recombinase family protein n=1 Tax=[Clostridium] colinum TaxID=36835 RepID=UPI00202455FB|nr:recombinase family protein [[Clostridium] colinum]